MKYQLEECLGSRFRVISRKIDSIYRKHLGKSGITENQLSIMMALYKTGSTEQKIIGEILNLEKSSLSRNLIRLIKAGYILKKGIVNKPLIELTKKGKHKVEELIPLWEQTMDEIQNVLNKDDLKAFSKIELSIRNL